MSGTLREHGLAAWRAAERGFDAAFGSALNPLRHLGAIGMLAFWVLLASGGLLFVFFDTSASGAWPSIHALEGHAAGRLLRGAHRYAADLLVLAMGLHVLREWLHGHAGGFRRYSWLTGVPLVALFFVSAIGGFWLNWDQLGQYSAQATAEWLDGLPGSPLALPVARNFLAGSVGDRLFSLFIFVHVGVALMALFTLWFHLHRIARAAVWPPKPLAWGLLAVLAALPLVQPVLSHAPAALTTVPTALRLDWLLLFVHPLVDATSPGFVWAGVGALFVVLFSLPWLPRQPRRAVAVVDPEHCNGCQRCLADCPYAAISLTPHPNPRMGRELAVVNADICAGCGLCAGACPSSTPSRARRGITSGIELPDRRIAALYAELRAGLAALAARGSAQPLVLFGCEQGAATQRPARDEDVCRVGLVCAGQLPPSFVDLALRDGAAGVVIAACREGGCEFRFGERWTAERLNGAREPRLRPAVDGRRVELVHAGPGDGPNVEAALARLRDRLHAMPLEPSHV